MCGIVGFISKDDKELEEVLVDGLRKLEYRGYDSSGVAFINHDKKVSYYKKAGRIANLSQTIPKHLQSHTAIGHTRWATHGKPTDLNAHPHISEDGTIAIVHNGIIENYTSLKDMLKVEGIKTQTETDSELIAQLIQLNYSGNIEDAVLKTLKLMQGTYGLAVISSRQPDILIGARKGSPLIIGISDHERFIASDPIALNTFTNRFIYLEDGETVILSPDNQRILDHKNITITKSYETIEFELDAIEKKGYDDFMIKEICEQPEAISRAFQGRINADAGSVKLGGLNFTPADFLKYDEIRFLACGTSYHSSMIGAYALENIARVASNADLAAEFRYRNPLVRQNSLYVAVSQSGETIDTLLALREVHTRGGQCIGVCNAVGSSIARESNGGIYTHAGPEVSVASTKCFTNQLIVFYLLTLAFARVKSLSSYQIKNYLDELIRIPDKMNQILNTKDEIEELSEVFKSRDNFLFLGRGYNHPVALEGALKLKEVSYIHAEGYSAAEMKHGPIALIDENMPVVVIALQDELYPKMISNMEEIKARHGRLIAVATDGDHEIKKLADHVLYVPKTIDMFSPLLTVVPLQLLAYYTAIKRECNVDKPRNLAKSVTVE